MSAAPSWPLISSPFKGAHLPSAIAVTSGCISNHFEGRKLDSGQLLVLNLFFRPLKRKTTCGAQMRNRPSDPSLHGLQKPEIAQSPNGSAEGNAAAPNARRAFVLPPPYGMTIAENREASPRIPTHFRVPRAPGRPFARLLQVLCQKTGDSGYPTIGQNPGSRLAWPGFRQFHLPVPPPRHGRACPGHPRLWWSDPRIALGFRFACPGMNPGSRVASPGFR
jgi:hypothetical protein